MNSLGGSDDANGGVRSDAGGAPTRSQAFSSVRWSVLAVLGRQLPQMIAALVLARVLGPEAYGVISAATVYVTFTTLLLDQGLAAALVQRPALPPGLSGAVTTVNLLSAAVLGGATVATSDLVAHFFTAPMLAPLLGVLGGGLLLKGVAITPRALLQRDLRFQRIGLADLVGGTAGAAAGITAALAGAGIWSMTWMVLTTDSLVALLLAIFARSGWPNLRFGLLREILPFSLRVFGSNALAFLSRNLDNILVGRFLGVASLSLYSMSYRVLVVPVQFIGQTVNRVVFPIFSRVSDERHRLAAGLLMATEILAFTAVPVMVGISVASPELIELILGAKWAAAAPVLTVLAVAGARETVFNVTNPLMRAKGAGKEIFRYEWLAAAVQLSGIAIGLQFGVFGVAVGLLAAGVVLSPVLLAIQRHFTGLTMRSQLGRMLPPVHASMWGAVAYVLVRWWLGQPFAVLAVGLIAYLFVTFGVLGLIHRSATRRAITTIKELLRPGNPAPTQ
ncbi:lipopolysaccharide biosynthesis protein [Micropruina sp.]|uniref:lipopolysaccharide biosynthesis protein n=1 Tax=Micropruina sp. TaxID=2737536 RepID=UPI0039E419FB